MLKNLSLVSKNNVQKILICGANGNVGRDLVYFLSKKFKILQYIEIIKIHLSKTIILNG